ncbi:MAG: glycoside hydrolase family 130 protein [Actinomycetota bacterium]
MNISALRPALVTRTSVRLTANPARVLATLFMPGQEMLEDHSRATAVINRVLTLSDDQVAATLADIDSRFAGRHRDLDTTFLRHYSAVSPRMGPEGEPSEDRRRLIGAYFTHEVSPEGAALTNPSLVEHPDQSGLEAGELRFVLSLRAVGEGHISSLEFRTGVIGADLEIRLEEPTGLLAKGWTQPALYDRGVFDSQLTELGCNDEVAHLVLDALRPRFDKAALDGAIAGLDPLILSRAAAQETVYRLGWVAANNYQIAFAQDSAIDERILVPTGPTERNGIEDARFVRLVEDDASVTYYATYTAYDGSHVVPQILATTDFRTFRALQLTGASAKNKGMALFPRRIGGRYMTLSRWDRESNSLAASENLWAWGKPKTIQLPVQPWELIQIGNCGSPIETAEGWLVLTHGVGPMRTYAIGAILLDLEDPALVIGALDEPLLVPTAREREGYVPNVVYSCGALLHGDALVLPFGYSDQAVGMALIDIPSLLNKLLSSPP